LITNFDKNKQHSLILQLFHILLKKKNPRRFKY